MQKEHHGFLYGIAAAITSSISALFIKLSVSASVSTLVFARFAFGLPIMLWIIYHKKINISWKKVPKNLTRSLGSILSIYTYYYAVQKLLLVNAVTLSNTSPLFIPFLTLIWLKLLVSKRRFLATAIGFVGVLVLLRPTGEIFEWASVVGLSSGFFGAIALISVRQLSKTENTETILSYYFLLGVVIAFLPLPFTWQPIAEPIQWLYIFLSSVCAFIYQFTITKAYTHAPATKVSTLTYLSVVFSGLLGWWVFAEIPDYWVLIGTLLIVCGALIALFDQTSAKRIGKLE